MTLFTAGFTVLAHQLKECLAVVKFLADRFHAIMTAQAAFTIGFHMLAGKSTIQELVTIGTVVRRKSGHIINMAVRAANRPPIPALNM